MNKHQRRSTVTVVCTPDIDHQSKTDYPTFMMRNMAEYLMIWIYFTFILVFVFGARLHHVYKVLFYLQREFIFIMAFIIFHVLIVIYPSIAL